MYHSDILGKETYGMSNRVEVMIKSNVVGENLSSLHYFATS